MRVITKSHALRDLDRLIVSMQASVRDDWSIEDADSIIELINDDLDTLRDIIAANGCIEAHKLA